MMDLWMVVGLAVCLFGIKRFADWCEKQVEK